MSSNHATLAPSSAPQWGNCSGSLRAQILAPKREEPEASRTGTAAHWVWAEVLNGNAYSCYDLIGSTAPNGVIIDESMAEGADIMCQDVNECGTRLNSLDALLVEHRVNMPQIHPENWGTLDAALYVPDRRVLFIWDYKHGHRQVKAKDNLQLINYAAGVVNKYQINGAQDQNITVVFKIVQPYCYHKEGPVEEWRITLSDLRGAWNQLREKAYEALSENPKLSTGPWCRDCKAVGICPAVRQRCYNFIDLVNEPYALDDMQGLDLATEYQLLNDGLPVIKARIDAIDDSLKHLIQSGDKSTGLGLENTKGRLSWTIPNDQVRALGVQFGIDVNKDEVLTPTQAKNKTPKEMRPFLEAVLKEVTHRPPGKSKLVNADDSLGARAFKRK